MDDSKIKELQALHRELAKYLAYQSEVIITLRRTVWAIQQTLDNDSAPQGGRSALANKYREYLPARTPIETPQPNLTEALSQATVDSLVENLNKW